MDFRAAGEGHYTQNLNDALNSRRYSASLVPEPSNRQDRNAVMVQLNGKCVAYVPRELCDDVKRMMKKPYDLQVDVNDGGVYVHLNAKQAAADSKADDSDTALGKLWWLILIAAAAGICFLVSLGFSLPLAGVFFLIASASFIGFLVDTVKASREEAKKNAVLREERRRLEAEQQAKRDAERAAACAAFDAELAEIPRTPVSLSAKPAARHDLSVFPEITYAKITVRTKIENLFPFVVVDTETTGFSPQNGEIIEVSAIKYDVGFRPVSCFTSLVKPKRRIPPEASAVNHITDDMVKDAPPFGKIVEGLQEYAAGCNIIGHNLPFDLKFLHVGGLELTEKRRYFDTLYMSKLILNSYKERYNREGLPFVADRKLDTLCEHYGIYRSVAHRSLADCLATGKLFQKFVEEKTAGEGSTASKGHGAETA